MLNNQAKKDLLNLYKTIKTKRHELIFWSVLECAGCTEEFRKYLENTVKRNETTMLDNQAKKDLLNLYKTIKTKRHELIFWSVLGCAGCAEEFKEYLENTEERNETK